MPLQYIWNAMSTEARDGPPTQAACIYDVVSDQVAILVKPMVCLAKSDTGAAAGHKASVDGIEALEEGGGPRCRSRGIRNTGVIFGDVIDTVHPAVDITLHLGLLMRRGCHFW